MNGSFGENIFIDFAFRFYDISSFICWKNFLLMAEYLIISKAYSLHPPHLKFANFIFDRQHATFVNLLTRFKVQICVLGWHWNVGNGWKDSIRVTFFIECWGRTQYKFSRIRCNEWVGIKCMHILYKSTIRRISSFNSFFKLKYFFNDWQFFSSRDIKKNTGKWKTN